MNHARHGLKNQFDLGDALRNIFPSHYVISNARNYGALVQVENGSNLELDYWIPELKLAFEFQDPHHYVASLHSHEPLPATQLKDEMKKQVLSLRGDTLIAVPCWWDGKEKSLVNTIRATRPDLLADWKDSEDDTGGGESEANTAEGIPLVPPNDYFEAGIPSVGYLLQPIFANNLYDLEGWWIGEKYDGIRVCWNVEKRLPYLRSGNVLQLPGTFKRYFPTIYLDGEIWFGRGSFHASQAVLADEPGSIAWSDVRFVAFDDALNENPYELRFETLLRETVPENPFIVATAVHRAPSTLHVHKWLKELVPEGGEGIVARMPESLYVHGRAVNVLKFKAYKDLEALVVEIEESDVTGEKTFHLKLHNDVTIKAQYPSNTPDEPLPGDIVTLFYNTVNAQGVPSNATILRVRRDLTWDHVLRSNVREAELNNQSESALIKRSRKIAGYWTMDENKNIRAFLDDYARSQSFDPLVPTNWMSTSTRDILAAGGAGFLSAYNGSLIKCLVDVYPDIGLRITLRNKLPQGYWQDRDNRKQVFDKVAKSLKFDPLIQRNWHWVTRQHIHAERGGSSALDYYEGSIGNALKDIYPTVPWHEPNFFRRYWYEALNRRKFFDDYAQTHNFDPLIASNWYSVTTEAVLKHTEGHAVMAFYKNIMSALEDLYPNIYFDKLKFSKMPAGYWTANTKRDFFDRFAKERGFDPLIADNWYSLSTADILAVKGGASVLRGYGGVIKAIFDLYPDLSYETTLLSAVPARYWNNAANRKNMLVRIAYQKALDPLLASTWLKINSRAIKKISGGRHLLKATKGLRNALIEAFPDMKLDTSRPIKSNTHGMPSIWDRIIAKQNSSDATTS